MSNIAIIVAAGSSSRCGLEIAKQYQKINGKSILSFSIEKFQAIREIDDIIIVVNKKDKVFYTPICNQYNISHVVFGGRTRQESVFNALKYLQKSPPKNILIHDAARPFVNERIIKESLNLLKSHNATIPVIPIEDTLKHITPKQTMISVDRDNLYRVQTPQGFDYQLLYSCHINKKDKNFTDDSTILEEMGFNIATFKGSQLNFKITTLDDLLRAQKMHNNYTTRTGIGFDVHRFASKNEDTYITLGGVAIKSDKKLIAHSDGDVLIHSLVDALLGSIAAGDIGDHFPPTDNKYKNKDSSFFLRETMYLLDQQEAKIINIDGNIICETPKITPHKKQIRKNLANILQIDINKISIKATTTEKLGFTGRSEGIAVQMIVNIKTLSNE